MSSASATGTSYRLDGDNKDLAKYVGKRVEVMGRIDNSGTMSGASSSSTPPASSSTSSSSSASSSMAQHLKVSSVREIGGDCSR